MLALVAASVGITAVLTCAGDGSLLYNTRDGYARWLDWIAPAVNLAHALPSLFQGGVATAWAQAAMWCAALAAGWYGLRILERRSVSSFLAVPLVAIAVASLGASGGWTVSGHTAIEPGSSAVAMLRAACGRDRALVRVAPFAWSVSRRDDAAFGVQDAGRRPMAAGGPLWTGRDMPPGRYRVLLDTGLNVTGELTIALGKPDATLQQCAFAEHRPGTTDCIVDLPAGATWLWMTPDSAMRASIEGLRLQPISHGQVRHVCAQSRPRRRDTGRRDVCGEGKRVCRAGWTVGHRWKDGEAHHSATRAGKSGPAERSDREPRSRRNPSVVRRASSCARRAHNHSVIYPPGWRRAPGHHRQRRRLQAGGPGSGKSRLAVARRVGGTAVKEAMTNSGGPDSVGPSVGRT